MLKGLLTSLLVVMDDDAFSQAWPVCHYGGGRDEDRCPCNACAQWRKFKRIRGLLEALDKEMNPT